MWRSSSRFLVILALFSLTTLSPGTPVPQQVPAFPARAAALEPEDDAARLRRYRSYGLKQSTVERVQPVSNVHPDAAPFVNMPDIGQANANPAEERGSADATESTLGVQQARSASAPAPAPETAPVTAPLTTPVTAPVSAPIAGTASVTEGSYGAQREGMVGSARFDNDLSPATSMQAPQPNGVKETSSGEEKDNESALPTSDSPVQISSGGRAFASQGVASQGVASQGAASQGAPDTAQRTEAPGQPVASSALPEGIIRRSDSSSAPVSSLGSASSAQAAGPGATSVPEATGGVQTTSLVGMSTIRQGIPQHNIESAQTPSYDSMMTGSTVGESEQLNGLEASSQMGERVDVSGTLHASQEVDMSGPVAVPVAAPVAGNVENEPYTGKMNADGPMVGSGSMVE